MRGTTGKLNLKRRENTADIVQSLFFGKNPPSIPKGFGYNFPSLPPLKINPLHLHSLLSNSGLWRSFPLWNFHGALSERATFPFSVLTNCLLEVSRLGASVAKVLVN